MPTDGDAVDFEARLAAATYQQALLTGARQALRENGLNFKAAVLHFLLSDAYRAKRLVRSPSSPSEEAIAQTLGASALATPEQLTRRIEAIFGEPWIFRYSRPLIDPRRFELLFGGIDSRAMTQRIREPNALMGSVITLMSQDIGCRLVNREFSRPQGQRHWLPGRRAQPNPRDP